MGRAKTTDKGKPESEGGPAPAPKSPGPAGSDGSDKEEGGYSVEKILDKRELSKGRIEYLLKWQGYGE